ncbi:hypothetical protein RFI_34287 [Reticulomyxa filosa]|uniref:Uncharacterized protein n=1 Tax=Reticulomyxa filosa TaxID=46433 RepID=X6LME8_RETFI|nr:hypothetical protein RFI_34287 [Reticulomyxa filosa]|eukprot:ETO03123.1 hypothetical protein RFI_34287 [Reticulomyxa filosa]
MSRKRVTDKESSIWTMKKLDSTTCKYLKHGTYPFGLRNKTRYTDKKRTKLAHITTDLILYKNLIKICVFCSLTFIDEILLMIFGLLTFFINFYSCELNFWVDKKEEILLLNSEKLSDIAIIVADNVLQMIYHVFFVEILILLVTKTFNLLVVVIDKERAKSNKIQPPKKSIFSEKNKKNKGKTEVINEFFVSMALVSQEPN